MPPTLRHAVRKLAQKPSVTLLAVLTLAIGLGANAAIFAVVDAVLLRPLPYTQAERLVDIGHAAPGLELLAMNMSPRLYVHYREHAGSLAELALYDSGRAAISGLERPVEVGGAFVTPSLFPLLGASPARGRTFTEAEGMPGAPPVALLSHALWQRQLGGDPGIVGRSLEIDGELHEVVGVMQPDFAFPEDDTDVWLPLEVDPVTAPLGEFGAGGVGRLAPGVAIETAQAELERFAGDLPTHLPDEEAAPVLDRAGFTVEVRPLREAVVGDLGPVLWVLLATVGFVLLLACFNVANLFLARAEERQRETAIRVALGAGRGTLVSAALAEGLLLSITAGGLGLLLAAVSLRPLLAMAPQGLPRAGAIAVDLRTVAAVTVLAVVSGIVFGLIPALRGRFRELGPVLKEGGRSRTAGRAQHRARRVLVVAQMAIALVLLVGAGLMARSFQRLSAVDPGFQVDRALTFRLSLPESRAADPAAAARFYDDLLSRLAALPGVEAVGSTTIAPLTGRGSGSGHRLADRVREGEMEVPIVFSVQLVSPEYFAAMGIPLVAGRALERADFENASGKVVVNRALAERHWPGESAIGKRVFPGTPEEGQEWLEIVGVVGDVRHQTLTDEPPTTIYYPWVTPMEEFFVPRSQTVVVRTAGSPQALADAVQQTVWSLDPDLPLAEVRTLDELVRRARSRLAFTAVMLLLAAGVAVALGLVGTYAVISFLVAQRTSEIGVRKALGAQQRDVLGLVLRDGLLMAGAGTLLGLGAAFALSRGLESVLYDVEPYDPLTYAVVPVVLLAVAILACLVPARRASRIDPAVALRNE